MSLISIYFHSEAADDTDQEDEQTMTIQVSEHLKVKGRGPVCQPYC